MKKKFTLLLAVLLLLSLLTACGAETAAGNGVAMDSQIKEEMEAPGEGIYGSVADSSTGSSTTTAPAVSSQKLIRTVSISAETEDLDGLLAELTGQITALGGYTEYQNIYNGSSYQSYHSRSAELTVRIPADRLSDFLTQVEGFSNVISKTESVDDVTLRYTDTQSRMEALQAEHDRLVELMDQAETMADLLEIEARLTDVRYELESVTSALRVLDNQVTYATIELYIDEVEVLTEVEEPTVWQRITTGLIRNLENLWEFLVDLFVWIIVCSPQLLLLAGIATLIVWLCRRAARKRKAPKAPWIPPQTPENDDN